MRRDARKFDWKEMEDAYITQWYFASKIMGKIFPKHFPYFTFAGIVEEISNDPNYKKKEDT